MVGFILAPSELIDWERCFTLTFILFLIVSSAALMNNLIDYTLDQKMGRTQERKILIDSFGKNFLWGLSTICLVIGNLFAYLFFDWLTVVLLLCAFFSYVIWYSIFLKRKDAFGVILGGLPGALPLPIGYVGAGYGFSPIIAFLFTYMMLWQPAHFWLLALYRKKEYDKADIPILPLVYGDKVTAYFIYIYSLVLIPISLISCFTAQLHWVSYIIIFALGVYFLLNTFYALEKTKKYQKAFKASLVYLLGYMCMFLFDTLLLS